LSSAVLEMADGSKIAPEERTYFPGVRFREDDPKNGFVTLILTMQDLKMTRRLFKQDEVNAAVTVNYTSTSVEARVRVNDGGKTYVYKMSLPYDIVPEKSGHKPGDGFVQLTLAKRVPTQSWASESKYLMQHRA